MKKVFFNIAHIPCCLWGEKSNHLLLFVHGKGGNKEERKARLIAEIAHKKGYQMLSFDLAEHGNRQDTRKCDVFDGVEDLKCVYQCVSTQYEYISLIANSIGAYFSLQAFNNLLFQQCLLYSPVIDMPYLIGQMMTWFSVTIEQLREKGVIDTPVDPLRYDYYQYAFSHPIEKWQSPTSILFGEFDNLQTKEIMEKFCLKFNAKLTIVEGASHPLMEQEDINKFKNWIETTLK